VRPLAHLVIAFVVLVGGVATGFVTVAVHEARWGLWLGIAATAATLVAVGSGRWRRLAYGLGFCAAVGYAVVRHPGGGYLIASDWHGHVLIGFAYVVLAFSFATLPRRVRRVDTDPGT
jgi:hypothetical protein